MKPRKLRDLSIAKKYLFYSVMPLLLSALLITFTLRILFQNAMLDTASEAYSEKFQTVSNNCLELFQDAKDIASLLLTDAGIQEWYYQGTDLPFPQQLQLRIRAESQLDYMEALRGRRQFSSITLFHRNGQSVQTNGIRSLAAKYLPLYTPEVQQSTKGLWVDLFSLHDQGLAPYGGIAYSHPFRDYSSGQVLGHVMIEYRDDILIDHFAQLRNGNSSFYMVLDQKGDVKFSSFQQSLLPKADDCALLSGVGEGFCTVGKDRCFYTGSGIPTLHWTMVGIVPVGALTERSKPLVASIYGIALLAILISVLTSRRLTRRITKPLTDLSRAMESFGGGDLNQTLPISSQDEVGALAQRFNDMAQHIRQLLEQVRTEQRDKRKFEFSALQAQINPHFLYNTLNSVCSLIQMKRSEDAYEMIRDIGTFYRTALSNGKVLIPISDEIENIRSYIAIQSTRYRDKNRFEIDVPPEVLEQSIVKFTLQPLIENAIYHGVKQTEGQGLIRITGQREAERVLLTVEDNGAGMEQRLIDQLLSDEAEIQKTSYGLTNINRRLKLYFGPDYGLNITSEPGEGTQVRVLLPIAFKGGEVR